MDLNKDAYGWEVWDYQNKKEGFEIIHRGDNTYWISSGPKSYFSKYKDWPENLKKALKLAKGSILDVGCGAGRTCLYLQKKGHKVVGIDNSPLAVKTCKARGVKNVKIMGIEDIEKLKEKFDTILMLGNNFGLFGSYKKAKDLLKKMHTITSKEAVIIAESIDPYKTKDPLNLEYQKSNVKQGRMAGQLKLQVVYKKYIGNWFDYLIVSKKEMKDILKGTGWKIRAFINPTKWNKCYIAIIEKEKK
ncbi:MAG: class I SAM-dependent methyltransferase [Candidatus ainarchaeum sp.]|nr:class I SAM-dependent methyltransferase [Candidatus ainarchaeum sp.]